MPYTNNDEGKRYTIVGTKNTLIPEYGTAPRTYKQKAHDKVVALRTGYIDDADAGAEGAIDLVTSDRHPIHFFNMSFWPLPGSIRTASTTQDASTVLFDPHVNSFDLVKKEAEDITLVCEICHAHLQVLRCETCRMGYCFSCGFTAHAKDQRQRHRITMAAPRVVSEARTCSVTAAPAPARQRPPSGLGAHTPAATCATTQLARTLASKATAGS